MSEFDLSYAEMLEEHEREEIGDFADPEEFEMSEPTDYLRHELLQDLGESFVESYDALSDEARSGFARTLRLLRSDSLANEFTAMKLAETEAKLSKMEEAQAEAKKLMDDSLDRAEQNPPDDNYLGDEAWWKQRTRFVREALAGGDDELVA